jgi:hypothetical protein
LSCRHEISLLSLERGLSGVWVIILGLTVGTFVSGAKELWGLDSNGEADRVGESP